MPIECENHEVEIGPFPGFEARRLVLRGFRLPVKDEPNGMDACWHWTVAETSLRDLLEGGLAGLGDADPEIPWWALARLLQGIPPDGEPPDDPDPRQGISRLREARMWPELRHWTMKNRSRWRTDDRPEPEAVYFAIKAGRECAERLAERLKSNLGGEFPDEEYVARVGHLLRETDKEGVPIEEPEGFGEFRLNIFELAASNPRKAAREIANAQKSENEGRKRMVRFLALEVSDMLFRFYAHGMDRVLKRLTDEGRCMDPYSQGLFLFFHFPHEYLDGIVPAFHPIYRLFVCNSFFMESALRRFGADPEGKGGVQFNVLADFYGAVEGVVLSYSYYVGNARMEDSEGKKRRRGLREQKHFDQAALRAYKAERAAERYEVDEGEGEGEGGMEVQMDGEWWEALEGGDDPDDEEDDDRW